MSRVPIDFSALENYDRNIRQKQFDVEKEEAKPFPIEEVLYLAVWSRVCEAMRFTFSTDLEEAPSKKVIQEEIRKSIQGNMGGSQISGLSEFEDEKRAAEVFSAIDVELDSLWNGYEKCLKRDKGDGSSAIDSTESISGLQPEQKYDVNYQEQLSAARTVELKTGATFGGLFDYQFPDFPETTEDDRIKLRLMAQQHVAISKRDVMQALNVEEDSQLVQYLFVSGANVIGNEVFKEIVASLGVEPRSLSFAPEFATNQAGIASRMATVLPNIIILILILVFGPRFSSIAQFQLFSAINNYIGDDYDNYCSFGVDSDLGCDWIRKSVLDTKWPTFDVMRFTRKEVINKLWTAGDNATAARMPMTSTWLIGALSIRHVLDSSNDVFSGSKALCTPSNLSTTIVHLEMGYSYGCAPVWQVVVPFGATKAQAFDMVKDLNMSLPSTWYTPSTDVANLPYHSSGLIFDFTSYQRNYGLLVHTRILISLPRGGSALSRMEISPIDGRVHNYVLPLLIVQLMSFLLVLGTNITLFVKGVPSFGFEFFRGFSMAILLCVAYIYLRLSDVMYSDGTSEKLLRESLENNFYESEFLPGRMDHYAQMFNTGMSCLGFYIFFFITFLGRFFRDIPGLELVVTVLRRTWLELLILAFVFLIWTLGFICIGMYLFSDTLVTFGNMTTAAFTLTGYFFGNTNYDELYDAKPIAGPIFYFILQLFVLFFALNLLIAVLTAPLTDIKVDTNADNAILEEIELELFSKKAESTSWDYVKWWSYTRVFLPLVGVLMDARPVGTGFWLANSINLNVLYPKGAPPPILGRIQGCSRLVADVEILQNELRRWNSPILQHVLAKKLIKGKVSLAICLSLIVRESHSTWVRDSRLLAATFLYRRWIQRLEEVMDTQQLLTEIADKNTSRLRDKLDLASQGIEKAHSSMSLAVKREIAAGNADLVAATTTSEDGQDQDPSEPGSPTSDGSLPRYYFSDDLEKRVSKGPYQFLYAILVLAFALWFITPFMGLNNTTAFLTQSARDGLLTMHMTTKCHDAQCTNPGWSQPWYKHYTDQVTLNDLRNWLQTVLKPQLFFPIEKDLFTTSDLTPIILAAMAASNNYTAPVWWDPRLLRVGPVKFRQLRGAPRSCTELPTDDSVLSPFYQARKQVVTEDVNCFANLQFDQSDRIPPPAVSRTYLPNSAYQWQKECLVASPENYVGDYGVYPCEGYYLDIYNSTDLQEMLDFNWLDNATRLITMTVRLWKPDDAAEIDYTLLAEMGDMGFGVTHYDRSYARSKIDTIEKTKNVRIAFQVILCLHMFLYVCLYIRFFLHKLVWHAHRDALAFMKPSPPISLLLTFVVLFVVIYPSTVNDYQKRDTAIGITAAIYVEIILSGAVVFPGASLLSKNVKILFDTLHHAALHCLYVIPFLGLFYLSFSYGGLVIFGRFVFNFSQIRYAMLQVLLGTFGAWDVDSLQVGRPIEAQIFTIFFFCAVIIILANMFLAVVTSASADANVTPPGVLVAESVQLFYGRKPLYGHFLNSYLGISIAFQRFLLGHPEIKKKLPKFLTRRRKKDPAILTPWGRTWFGLECLLPRLRPLQVNRVLKQFCHEELGGTAMAALIPFVITNWLEFRDGELVKFAADERSNAQNANSFVKEVALENLLRKIQDEDLGSPNRKVKMAFASVAEAVISPTEVEAVAQDENPTTKDETHQSPNFVQDTGDVESVESM